MRILAGAVLSALALAELASAAMWTRISVDPPSPLVGEQARVTVFTFYLTERRYSDDPAASPVPNAVWSPPLTAVQVVAVAPSGNTLRLVLRQRADDGSRWESDASFSEPGRWTLRLASPLWGSEDESERCAGFRTELDVRARSPAAFDPYAALALAVLVGAFAGGLVQFARRSPQASAE